MKKYSIFFAFSLLFASYSALAAKVSAVKNNKVMIELDGDNALPGAEFFILNGQNKRVALVKVTQVKNGRAIGEISKGTAQPGWRLQIKSGGWSASSGSSSSGGDDYYERKLNQKSHNGNSWGVVGGYLMNSMTVSTTSMKIDMSGTGFGALGYYDYAFSPSITKLSPSRLAVVLRCLGCAPAPGSEIATAMVSAPQARRGSNAAFCASLPKPSTK